MNVLKVDFANPAPEILSKCAEIMRSGGVIVYPTETLYGIGADAMNAAAVQKVYNVKKRRDAKPLLVIVPSLDALDQVTVEIGDSARKLITSFWPGPLTIVFKASEVVPQALTQGSGTVGVRIPSSELCRELARLLGRPITSTSANLSGQPMPRTVEGIRGALNNGIDLFLDAGQLPESEPSTVVSVVDDPPRIIRHGAVSFDQILKVIPNVQP